MKYNQELVEKVRKGELAIKNDGTLDELQALLNFIFPNDKSNTQGHFDYYERYSLNHNHWTCYDATQLPYKSVKDFIIHENINSESNAQINYKEKLQNALTEISDEVLRAKQKYPNDFVNQHEAYAVFLEEAEELWDEIKKKQSNYDLPAQRKEATQAAAMLVRLIVELL